MSFVKNSNPDIFANRCRRPLIFPTLTSERSISLSLKDQRFTPSGCTSIGIRELQFVGKTLNDLFLLEILLFSNKFYNLRA